MLTQRIEDCFYRRHHSHHIEVCLAHFLIKWLISLILRVPIHVPSSMNTLRFFLFLTICTSPFVLEGYLYQLLCLMHLCLITSLRLWWSPCPPVLGLPTSDAHLVSSLLPFLLGLFTRQWKKGNISITPDCRWAQVFNIESCTEL